MKTCVWSTDKHGLKSCPFLGTATGVSQGLLQGVESAQACLPLFALRQGQALHLAMEESLTMLRRPSTEKQRDLRLQALRLGSMVEWPLKPSVVTTPAPGNGSLPYLGPPAGGSP